MDHAVAQYEKAHQVAHLNEHAAERQMDEAMGVALLHKSEMENGVYRTPGDRCLAPMRPSSAYANKQDSKKAIEYFLKYLEQKPDELEVRWLLNLAYAVWVDINNDGLLDLFVGNEGQPAQLFLNRGDGTFEDISVNYFLYHNNHDNTFTEVARSAGVLGSGRGFATWFFDYDNDGLPDIFATSYFLSIDETARTYLGIPHNATTLKLYRNLGNGTFRDVTQEVGLDKVYMPMGANFGDIDNDGFFDIFLGTGNPSYATLKSSVLLHNKGSKQFLDVTTSSGTGEWHKGQGVAFADLDNRGDEDIIFEVGGATLGDSHALRVFENPGHGNDWISLKLVGVKTNRAAIGARIKVSVENKGQGIRSILSHSRQRWIVWGFPATATHRPGQRCQDR